MAVDTAFMKASRSKLNLLLLILSVLAFSSPVLVSAKPLAPLQVRLTPVDDNYQAGKPVQFRIALRIHGQAEGRAPAIVFNIVTDGETQCDSPQLDSGLIYSLNCTLGHAGTTQVKVEAGVELNGSQWVAQDQFVMQAPAAIVFKGSSDGGVTRWRGSKRIVEYGL